MAKQAPDDDWVEVVYATPAEQRIVRLPREPGLTAGEAVRRSGLVEQFAEIGRGPLVLGVFGTRIAPERVLERGDRVEICRPLRLDPRQMRRSAAAAGGSIGKTDRERGKS